MRAAVLHQGFIPHYRVRFFELLNERADAEYVVFHGDPPSRLGHEAAAGPFDFPNVKVQNRELAVGSRTLTYQPVLRDIWRSEFDAVVLGTHIQFLSNHLVFAASRLRRRAVLYWGHGDESVLDVPSSNGAAPGGERPPGLRVRVAQAGIKLKYAASRLPDGYLVYTQGGAGRLLANGLDPDRITVVRNTLDMQEQIAFQRQLQAADEEALRAELGLDPRAMILLYLGRIYPAKRVEDLVEVARQLNERRRPQRSFQIVIIGDGPSADAVRARAAGVENIVFTGRILDQARIARYMRVASAILMPGAIGLVANHALAHGVPIIHQLSDANSPEMEYLTPGRDCLTASDLASFAELVADAIDSPSKLEQLSANALEARERLSMDVMVGAFDTGVREAIARRLAGPRH